MLLSFVTSWLCERTKVWIYSKAFLGWTLLSQTQISSFLLELCIFHQVFWVAVVSMEEVKVFSSLLRKWKIGPTFLRLDAISTWARLSGQLGVCQKLSPALTWMHGSRDIGSGWKSAKKKRHQRAPNRSSTEYKDIKCQCESLMFNYGVWPTGSTIVQWNLIFAKTFC